MRVIAGTARGRPLRGPRGEGVRPTSDKVKGAIFSMAESLLVAVSRAANVQPMSRDEEAPVDESVARVESEVGLGESLTEVWEGLRVLDLYAGTGALGIEALSRGAAAVDFVDASADSQKLIGENLRLTGLAERGRVSRGDSAHVLARATVLGLRQPYDVVFADPPYGDPSLDLTLEELSTGSHLAAAALVIVEHSRRLAPADRIGHLRLLKRRRHGDTEVSIYLNRGPSDEPEDS